VSILAAVSILSAAGNPAAAGAGNALK